MKATSREDSNQQAEILSVHRSKNLNLKKENKYPPLIFKVKAKKSAEPVYCNYLVMKKQYPSLLLNFLEQHVKFKSSKEERFESKSSSKEKEQKSQSKNIKKTELDNLLSYKVPEKRISRGRNMLAESQGIKHTPKRKKSLSPSPSPPRKVEADSPVHEAQQEPLLPLLPVLPPVLADTKPIYNTRSHKVDTIAEKSPALKVEEGGSESQEQQRENLGFVVRQRILDYDFFVEDMKYLNLLSPAVMPVKNYRRDVPKERKEVEVSQSRMGFNQIENQFVFQSDSFKESECSEFLMKESEERRQSGKQKPIHKAKGNNSKRKRNKPKRYRGQ